MKKITLLSLAVISTNLLANPVLEEIKQNIEGASKLERISYIQKLSKIDDLGSTEILITQLFSKDKRTQLSAMRALKKKDIKSIPLLINKMYEVYDDSKSRYRVLLIIEKIDPKSFEKIKNLNKTELSELIGTKIEVATSDNKNSTIVDNNKIEELKNEINYKDFKYLVKHKEIPSELSNLYFKNDFYFEGDVLESTTELDEKYKDLVIKSFVGLKSDRNIDRNLKFLEKMGASIENFLIEVLISDLGYMKEYSHYLIEKNNLQSNVINKVLDLVEIDDNYLNILIEFPNIRKYENDILNTYKISSDELKLELESLAKLVGLFKIQDYAQSERLAKNERERIEKEKEKKRIAELEKQKEMEELKVQAELIRISKIKEEKERQAEILRLEELEKQKERELKAKEESIKKQKFEMNELILVGLDIPEVRLNAILKAGELKLVESIDKIGDILNNENEDQSVRKNCIFSLVKIQHEKVLPHLEKATKSKDKRLAFIAKKSLSSLKLKTLDK